MGPHTKCKYDDRSRCLDQDLISLYCVRAIDAFCCCGECRICMRATSRLYSAIVRPVCCGVRRKMTTDAGSLYADRAFGVSSALGRQIRVGSLLPSVANVCGAMHRVRCGALVAVRCRCAAHLRGVCLTCKSRAMLAAMRRRKEYIAPALCGRVPRRAVVRCPFFFFFLGGRLGPLTAPPCHYGRREAMSRAYFATG